MDNTINITDKVINLTFNQSFKLNDQLTFNAIITAFLGINDGKKYIDIDICCYENIVFMGMKVEDSYDAFNSFKQNFTNMGINIEKQMGEKVTEWTEVNITLNKFPHIFDSLKSF